MTSINDTFSVSGTGENGVTVSAFAESRFTTTPDKGAAFPDANPADATGTTGTTWGTDGSFSLSLTTPGAYWVAATYLSVNYWKRYNVGGRVVYGTGAPGPGTGAPGDMYVDEATANIYGPKIVIANPTVAVTATGTTSLTIPAGTPVGSLMLLAVAAYNQAPTTPAGWTLVTSGSINVDYYAVYSKLCASGDPGSTITEADSLNIVSQAFAAYNSASGATAVGAPGTNGTLASGVSVSVSGAPTQPIVLAAASAMAGETTQPITVAASVGSAVVQESSVSANGTNYAGLFLVETSGAAISGISYTFSNAAAANINGAAVQLVQLTNAPAWSLVASAPSPTKLLSWTANKTAAYTASPGDAVPCDTTTATFAVTFPASPPANTQVRVKWVAGTAAPTVAAGAGATLDPTWTSFPNVGDSVDFSFNTNTSVWELV